jgi:hypothetical protein
MFGDFLEVKTLAFLVLAPLLSGIFLVVMGMDKGSIVLSIAGVLLIAVTPVAVFWLSRNADDL